MGFLRELFGPSREEIWRCLCDQTGASYVDGGFWNSDKVIAQHDQWTITLDTYTESDSDGDSSTTYTRMRAPYVNRDDFRFTIYRRGIFSDLGAFFGAQDVAVGYPEFDDDFIIKGTNESSLRSLFANPRLRTLLQTQPSVYLTVKDDEGWFGTQFPEGVDELYFRALGDIKDVEQLKSLYDLFAETLQELCRIGSAYETDPGMQL